MYPPGFAFVRVYILVLLNRFFLFSSARLRSLACLPPLPPCVLFFFPFVLIGVTLDNYSLQSVGLGFWLKAHRVEPTKLALNDLHGSGAPVQLTGNC